MSGGAMSIFDPIVPDDRSATSATVVDARPDPASNPVVPTRGRSFDPRSIQIAGLFTAGLVVLGLLVSNAAKPDPEPRPGLTSRGEPGAAAVEQVDLAPDPSAVPTEAADLPADVVDSDREKDTPERKASKSDHEDAWQDLRDTFRKGGKGRWRD